MPPTRKPWPSWAWGEVDHAVVGIGDSLQASILATATLFDLGVNDIWAKALTEQHERILERVGAKHIVFPEGDAGRRVAHRIGVKLEEYIELDEQFVLVEMTVPEKFIGSTVIEAGLRDDHGVSVVCHKPSGGEFSVTTGDTPSRRGRSRRGGRAGRRRQQVRQAGPTAVLG